MKHARDLSNKEIKEELFDLRMKVKALIDLYENTHLDLANHKEHIESNYNNIKRILLK